MTIGADPILFCEKAHPARTDPESRIPSPRISLVKKALPTRLVGMEGQPVYRRLSDVPGALDGALLVTPASVTASIAKDVLAAGVPRVWLHYGVGPGAVDERAVEILRGRGVDVVAGECPMMFPRRGQGDPPGPCLDPEDLRAYPRAA